MNIRENIRITLDYQGKKEGVHRFKVSFYNPELNETTSCLLDIQPNGSCMYPEVGQESFRIPCTCIDQKENVMEMTTSSGKTYVAGLDRTSTYFWTCKK